MSRVRRLRKYLKLIHEKINEKYPGFNEHLDNIGVIDEIWMWKWIDLCFLTCLGYDMVSKIFDIIFKQSFIIIYRLAIVKGIT